ncbi:hypothetical protein [Gemmata sp.]|uniref:hypothetical protein n=1 Tax=Gemmata sp. TaxID=1914242 RepID=UPI003F71D053
MALPPVGRPEAGALAAPFAVAGIVFLGRAIQINSGNYDPAAVGFLVAGVAALVLAVAATSRPVVSGRAAAAALGLGVIGLVYQFYQLTTEPPGWDLHTQPMGTYLAALAALEILTVPQVLRLPAFRWAYTAGWLAAFAVLAVWIVRATPDPFIDVYSWTKYSLEVLGEGRNPYAAWMPNLYGHDIQHRDGGNIYGRPVTADAQWVQCGYVYPPVLLLSAGAGYLAGEIRWAHVAAFVASGLALLGCRGRFAALAAALLLTSPRVFLMVQQSLTDTFCVGLVAVTACLASRSSRLTPWAFGVAVVSKQYMIFLIPLGLLLVPPPWDRKKLAAFFVPAAVAAAAVNLPWFLWDPRAILRSLMASGLPFRYESLTLLSAYTVAAGTPPPMSQWLQFAMLVPTYALVWARSARGPAGFALSAALVVAVFFAFSRHASCNHYFLVVGCAATGLAAVTRDSEVPPPEGRTEPPVAG